MSAWTCPQLPARPAQRLLRLVLEPHWKGLSADSEEKREPVSDIYTATVERLKALDPKRPIREAGITIAAPDHLPSHRVPDVQWVTL